MAPKPFAKKRVVKKSAAKKPGPRRVPAKRSVRPVRKHKELIKQESLGQQTESKLSFSVGRPDARARIMKAIGAPSFYMRNSELTLDGVGTGIQNVYTFFNADPTTLAEIGQQLSNVTGMGTSTQPSRYLLENVHHRMVFSNNSTAPTRLKLFWISQKRDTWNGNGTAYSMQYVAPVGAVYKWDGSPQQAFDVGLEAESNVAPLTTLPSTIPGNTPTMSKLFNDYFKIEREEEVEMATGGVHTVEVNRKFDRVIDASVYSCPPYLGIRGYSQWILAVSYGTPVRVTGSTPGVGPMTTSQVNIGCIEYKEYRYTQVQAAITTLNSGTVLTITDNSDTTAINPGSGASGVPIIS